MLLSVSIGVGLFGAASDAAPPKKAKTAKPQPTKQQVYKTVGDVELKMHIFEPDNHKPTDRRPAIVFFFGGGWTGGSPGQFFPHCQYLASRGMIAMSAEYRVKGRHGTPPSECVKDGKSAMRWIRRNAADLGVDPDKVAAGGGSAGGHVAAAIATAKGFDEQGEDTSVAAVPNALVLFNPVYDNGPDGYGHSRVTDYWKEFSPAHNIRKGMPPAIVFLGTQDKLIPTATAEKFKTDMEAVGSRSELLLFEGEGHGFFNFGRGGNTSYTKTVIAMDRFLASLGFLQGEPKLK
jgi:acetyl esterase/lipase